jgi:hypothetical protein
MCYVVVLRSHPNIRKQLASSFKVFINQYFHVSYLSQRNFWCHYIFYDCSKKHHGHKQFTFSMLRNHVTQYQRNETYEAPILAGRTTQSVKACILSMAGLTLESKWQNWKFCIRTLICLTLSNFILLNCFRNSEIL